MPGIKKNKSIVETVEIERLRAENAKAKAMTDYIAMMTDVELPEESEANENE